MAKILIPENIENYKAIVFDFDGVVVESNQIKRDLFFEIWGEYRDDSTVESALNLGGSRYEIIQRIYNQLIPKNLHSERSYEDYIDKYTTISQELISALKVNVTLKNMLEKYHNHKLLFINSATPRATLKKICKNLKIEKYFDGIYGVEVDKVQNFIDIFHKHDLQASEVLFYGDMKSDELVANSLNIDFIAVDSIGSDLKESL